jgi:hypothetical protein
MTQPDIDAVFANNYCIQIIETGFSEQFQASHRMGPAPYAPLRGKLIATYRNNTIIPLSFHLLISTFKVCKKSKYDLLKKFPAQIQCGLKKTQRLMLVLKYVFINFKFAFLPPIFKALCVIQ